MRIFFLIIRFLSICFLLHKNVANCSSNNNHIIEVFWYKPHYQCGKDDTSTPQNAANFIHDQFRRKTDFLAISQWENHHNDKQIRIGNPERYGSIGAICGYNSLTTLFTTPIVLFYEHDEWVMEASYPSSSNCVSSSSVLLGGESQSDCDHVCTDKVTPSRDNCCSCTFSREEYLVGDAESQNLGQRPWVAGIFRKKEDDTAAVVVCVVAAEFPHPLANQTLWDLNGHPTSDPRPFSIMRDICTNTLSTDDCIPNLNGTSVFFGTDIFVEEVSNFCGNLPIILMADTNAGAGDFPASSMFVTNPLHSLEGIGPVVPYACCNDTSSGGGLNRYASDQILVSSSSSRDTNTNTLRMERLEGGSIAPGGPIVDASMGYQCHANEEHAPLRAYISYNNNKEKKSSSTISRLRRGGTTTKEARTALLLTKASWL